MNNFSSSEAPMSLSVSAHFLDWSQFSRQDSDSPPFDEQFDLVLGADIVYEADHALWIKRCVEKLLKKPEHVNGDHPQFHLVVPLRSTHAAELGTIERVFAREDVRTAESFSNETDRVWDLMILSKDSILCDAQGDVKTRGGGNEVEYAYYTIGWVKL